jgi:ribosomal protein S18 acetylase RimI-like enzyme
MRRGWIRVAVDWSRHDKPIVGFVCVRHKVRQPETSLYFMGVDPDYKRQGIAKLLLDDMKEQCPNPRIALNVTSRTSPRLTSGRPRAL